MERSQQGRFFNQVHGAANQGSQRGLAKRKERGLELLSWGRKERDLEG